MQKAQKDSGEFYWEYVLLYVDDALCISDRGRHVLENEIGKYFQIKEGSVSPPTLYLGNKVKQVELENGTYVWASSSSQYVQAAVKNVEIYLQCKEQSLPKKAPSLFSSKYRPEIDVTPK